MESVKTFKASKAQRHQIFITFQNKNFLILLYDNMKSKRLYRNQVHVFVHQGSKMGISFKINGIGLAAPWSDQ